MNTKIEPIEGSENVRLTWDGFERNGTDARMKADFDACPHRKLTARESAIEWARTVLNVEVP